MKSELSLDVSDPDVQEFLAECKPGDSIIINATTTAHEDGSISAKVDSAEYGEAEEPESEDKPEYSDKMGKGKMPKGLMIVVGNGK